MKRLNSSHQSIAASQRNSAYKPDFSIASHTALGMIECESREPIIEEEDGDFLVMSPKFIGKYYRVWREEDAWYCSSREQAFADRCIARVQAYLSLTSVA